MDDPKAMLEEVLAAGQAVPSASGYFRDAVKASAWLAQAEATLAGIFPPTHPIHRRWSSIFAQAAKVAPFGWGRVVAEPHFDINFSQALGVIQGASELAKTGQLRTIFDGVRAETVGEVLEQAALLLGSNVAVPATVLAGGALETHLLHLCQRHGLVPPGDGAISKYDGAIAQARNAGTVEVYGSNDSKQIIYWGGMRNTAAHKPTEFPHTDAEVGLMIQGVRQFILRVQ